MTKPRASLAPRRHEGERRQGFRAVGVAASRIAAPIVARRGDGAIVRLKAEWAAIAGTEWAAISWPMALGRDGALRLRAATAAAALELQHRAPLLIERINLYFGRAAATRLMLVQGPLPLGMPPSGPPRRSVTQGEARAVDEQVGSVADPELRAALARLGRAIAAAEPATGEVAPKLASD